MPKKIYAMTSVLILMMGCATSGTVQPDKAKSVDYSSVEIGTSARKGCTAVDGFSLDRESRNNLLAELKKEAIKSGANFVKVTKMRVGNVTGKVKVRGVAMICPVDKKGASRDAWMMPLLEGAAVRIGSTSGRQPTRTAEVQKPGSRPNSPSLVMPEEEDDNPFE